MDSMTLNTWFMAFCCTVIAALASLAVMKFLPTSRRGKRWIGAFLASTLSGGVCTMLAMSASDREALEILCSEREQISALFSEEFAYGDGPGLTLCWPLFSEDEKNALPLEQVEIVSYTAAENSPTAKDVQRILFDSTKSCVDWYYLLLFHVGTDEEMQTRVLNKMGDNGCDRELRLESPLDFDVDSSYSMHAAPVVALNRDTEIERRLWDRYLADDTSAKAWLELAMELSREDPRYEEASHKAWSRIDDKTHAIVRRYLSGYGMPKPLEE